MSINQHKIIIISIIIMNACACIYILHNYNTYNYTGMAYYYSQLNDTNNIKSYIMLINVLYIPEIKLILWFPTLYNVLDNSQYSLGMILGLLGLLIVVHISWHNTGWPAIGVSWFKVVALQGSCVID